MSYTTHPIWPFRPNWNEGVLERLEWKTDTLTSEIGFEQRVSRRLTPRRSLEASFLIQKRDRQYLDSLMMTVGASIFTMPLWFDITRITADAGIGTDMVYLDTTDREYLAGGFVFLRGLTLHDWEVVGIQAVYPDHLKLISNLEKTWPAGSTIFPATTARLTDKTPLSKKHDRFITLSTTFSMAAANPYPSGITGYPMYQGNPVLTMRPDESEELTQEYQRNLLTLDNDMGLTDVTDLATLQNVQQYCWAFAGRPKHAALRKFLYTLRGRAGVIWLPTFMDDLTPAANIVASTGYIDVENCGYSRLAVRQPGRQDIRIELRDGTSYYRGITNSVEISSDVERIQLSSVLPATVAKGFVRSISFIARSRLEQDSIELNHVTDIDGLTIATTTWKGPMQFGANSVTWLDPVMPEDCDCEVKYRYRVLEIGAWDILSLAAPPFKQVGMVAGGRFTYRALFGGVRTNRAQGLADLAAYYPYRTTYVGYQNTNPLFGSYINILAPRMSGSPRADIENQSVNGVPPRAKSIGSVQCIAEAYSVPRSVTFSDYVTGEQIGDGLGGERVAFVNIPAQVFITGAYPKVYYGYTNEYPNGYAVVVGYLGAPPTCLIATMHPTWADSAVDYGNNFTKYPPIGCPNAFPIGRLIYNQHLQVQRQPSVPKGYTAVNGTFKQLCKASYKLNLLYQNALGPVVAQGDPLYNDAAFWAAKRTEAINSGLLQSDIETPAVVTEVAVTQYF